jgi:serine-type D-Ala-D-Ala carboxypeptidase
VKTKAPGNKETAAVPVVATVPELDRCIQTGIYDQVFSGAACIASVGGTIFHRAVYGNAVFPPPAKKLGLDALFDLASLTKPLATGVAALWLASKNRIDLNAGVHKTIPELKHERYAGMTIDMLLEHTSGFPATRSFWERLSADDAKLPPAQRLLGTERAVPAIRKLLAETLLENEPGSKAVYSDIGFIALGLIIENIVGQPLDTYLAREIYRPLGIADDLLFVRLDDARAKKQLVRRTFVATEDDQVWRKKLLAGEVHDPNAWAMGGVAGHAGLFGTADGVWKLVHALWESYKGTGRFFLGGTVRRFWTRSKRLASTTRTLAWDTPSAQGSQAGKRFSLTSVGHLGFTGCSVWIDLSTDIIGVVLTNAVHPTREGKDEALQKFRPRVYEIIGKHGEAQPTPGKAVGAKAFYDGPIVGPVTPSNQPLRGPRRG